MVEKPGSEAADDRLHEQAANNRPELRLGLGWKSLP